MEIRALIKVIFKMLVVVKLLFFIFGSKRETLENLSKVNQSFS